MKKLLRDGESVRICDLEFTFRDDIHQVELSFETQNRLTSDGSSIGMWDITDEAEEPSVTDRMEMKTGTMGVELSATADRKLTGMIEIMQKLSRSIKLDEVLPNVLEGLFQIFIQADRGFILLKNNNGELVPRCLKARRPDQEDKMRYSRTFMKHVMEKKEAVISLDASNDERFNQSQSVFDLRLRSVIVAPC